MSNRQNYIMRVQKFMKELINSINPGKTKIEGYQPYTKQIAKYNEIARKTAISHAKSVKGFTTLANIPEKETKEKINTTLKAFTAGARSGKSIAAFNSFMAYDPGYTRKNVIITGLIDNDGITGIWIDELPSIDLQRSKRMERKEEDIEAVKLGRYTNIIHSRNMENIIFPRGKLPTFEPEKKTRKRYKPFTEQQDTLFRRKNTFKKGGK